MMNQLVRGASWMIGFRLAERSFGIVSTLILARLLVPGDFGLIAMAMSLIAMIELASAFGFHVVLIQSRDTDRRRYDTAFTFNALFGLASACLMLLLSYPTAMFYQEPRLVGVICTLALAWAIQGFENVGVVEFQREMQFNREFGFLFAKRAVSFTVTMVMAFTLRSYWALVYGMIAGRVAGVIFSYLLHPYRPRFSLGARRELMSFSGWLLTNNILGFIVSRCSSFVIGKTGGPHDLGLYTVASEVGTLPTSEIVAPINRAVYPGYARMVRETTQLKDGFLQVLGAITMFAVPAAFGIAALAEPIIVVCFSAKWAEAAPLLKILGFLGASSGVATATYPAFLALGRPHTPTLINAVHVAVIVPAMIWAAHRFGVMGVAWVELGSALLILPLSWGFLFRLLQIRLRDFSVAVYRPFLAGAIMYAAVRGMLLHSTGGHPENGDLISVLSGVLLGVFLFVLIDLLLWSGAGRPQGIENRLFESMRSRFVRKAPR